MFSVHSHLIMLKDRIRMDAYRQAISKTVRNGDVVVDIGTGTGILAFFACQAGADKVYAIEQGEIIETAKKIAKENGFSDRIEFINKKSEEVELPEKADVIITETIGCFGIDENIVGILYDAKKRFLKKNGILVPSNLLLKAVPVHFKRGHPFSYLQKQFYGLKAESLKELAKNNVYGISAESLDNLDWISQEKVMLSIKLGDQKPLAFPVTMGVEFEINTEMDYHGICVFPETTLSENVKIVPFDNRSYIPTHWNITFFPAPVRLNHGENYVLEIKLIIIGKNRYMWRHVIKQGTETKEYTQFSLFGLPSLKRLIPEADKL